MKSPPTNIAASVHARLLNRARAERRPFNELLQYYVMERFLYRLSRSAHAERFVLKGGLMLQLWGGQLTRATKDIDLLGRDAGSVEQLADVIRSCVTATVEDDGLTFDPDTITGDEIRLAAHYAGVRIRCKAHLGNAQVGIQVDIGFGDVVTPNAQPIAYPTLLDFAAPNILGYTPESAIAEKLHAMVDLDMANTRMKDFLDIWSLATGTPFRGERLASAIEATFRRRATPLPESTPIALTAAFHGSAAKQSQWRGYVRKAHIVGAVPSFGAVATTLQEFMMPVLSALSSGVAFTLTWSPGGPWKEPLANVASDDAAVEPSR